MNCGVCDKRLRRIKTPLFERLYIHENPAAHRDHRPAPGRSTNRSMPSRFDNLGRVMGSRHDA